MTTISAQRLQELLERWPVARLATSGATGPHIVPIVFCLDNNALFSPVDGKAKSSPELQRLKNVQRNPRCSVLLDHYNEDWQQLWWVRLDAEAQICQPQQNHLDRLVGLLKSKYPQYQQTPVTQGRPTFLRLEWTSLSSWAQSEFTHARTHLPNAI
jgi:PPOX class probable F420-dependent enzyme